MGLAFLVTVGASGALIGMATLPYNGAAISRMSTVYSVYESDDFVASRPRMGVKIQIVNVQSILLLLVLFSVTLGSMMAQEATTSGVLLFAYRTHGHIRYNK